MIDRHSILAAAGALLVLAWSPAAVASDAPGGPPHGHAVVAAHLSANMASPTTATLLHVLPQASQRSSQATVPVRFHPRSLEDRHRRSGTVGDHPGLSNADNGDSATATEPFDDSELLADRPPARLNPLAGYPGHQTPVAYDSASTFESSRNYRIEPTASSPHADHDRGVAVGARIRF